MDGGNSVHKDPKTQRETKNTEMRGRIVENCGEPPTDIPAISFIILNWRELRSVYVCTAWWYMYGEAWWMAGGSEGYDMVYGVYDAEPTAWHASIAIKTTMRTISMRMYWQRVCAGRGSRETHTYTEGQNTSDSICQVKYKTSCFVSIFSQIIYYY